MHLTLKKMTASISFRKKISQHSSYKSILVISWQMSSFIKPNKINWVFIITFFFITYRTNLLKGIPEPPRIQQSASAFTTVEVSISPLPVLWRCKRFRSLIFTNNYLARRKSLDIYQSRTSRILGFPSEVTCNPAAAGSTPESRKQGLWVYKSQVTKLFGNQIKI